MKIVALFLTFLVAVAARAQLPITTPARAGFDPGRLEVLHAITKRFVDEGQHAGAITLLARNGKLVDFQTYGYRDLERKLPMERDTICRVYSMSKIITSVGVLALFEEGRFNLDEPVSKYLPELKDMKVMAGGTADAPQLEPLKRPITIQHLLTHMSGLISDFTASAEITKIFHPP